MKKKANNYMFSMVVKGVMVSLLLLLIPGLLLAESSTVKGVIQDGHGEPLHGATILILETGKGVVSDRSGNFQIDGLGEGTWTLLVRFVGYQSRQIPLQVANDTGEMITVSLQTETIMRDEMMITARMMARSARYQPVQSYRAEDIIKKNTMSLGTLLDAEPGVAMRSLGQAPARPVIRGMNGERVQMLENGMRMGDASSSAHDHAVMFDPSTAEQIDIVRGPASLIYGSSAMGGIVNIQSGDIPSVWNKGISGYAGVEGQTAMESLSGSGRITHASENKAFTFRGNVRNTGDMKTPIGSIPGTDLSSYQFSGGGSAKWNNGVAGASVSYMNQEYGIPASPSEQDEKVVLMMNRFSVQTRAYQQLNSSFFNAVESKAAYHLYSHDEWEYDLENGVSVDQDLELGIDQYFFQKDLLFQQKGGGVRNEGTTGLTFFYWNRDVSGDEALTPNVKGWSLAAFIIEELRLSDRLSMQSGIRMEWNHMRPISNRLFSEVNGSRSRGILAASVGFHVELNSSWSTGIQVSRAHRTPSAEELFADAIHLAAGRYEVGNKDLNDEKGYGVDVQLAYEAEQVKVNMAVYANRISDYITIRPTGDIEPERGLPVMRYTGSDALVYGMEAGTSVQWTDSWKSSVRMDIIIGNETDDDNRAPLPFMPPPRFFIDTGMDTGRWWAEARMTLVSSQNRIAENEEKTDGYVITGLNAGMRIGKTNLHHVSLSADNMFDVTWRDHLSRIEQRDIPMMGRNIRLAYRYYF